MNDKKSAARAVVTRAVSLFFGKADAENVIAPGAHTAQHAGMTVGLVAHDDTHATVTVLGQVRRGRRSELATLFAADLEAGASAVVHRFEPGAWVAAFTRGDA